MDLAPELCEYKSYKLKFIAIYASNSLNYWILDIASCLYGLTSVPIYDTLGEEATQFMFDQTNLSTCFLTTTHVPTVAKKIRNGDFQKLKTLVIMDDENLSQTLRDDLDGITYFTFSQLLEIGQKDPKPYTEV